VTGAERRQEIMNAVELQSVKQGMRLLFHTGMSRTANEILNVAQRDCTPEQYDELQLAWDDLVNE
jgi:hypothetical protein